jgi:hypothetical protein
MKIIYPKTKEKPDKIWDIKLPEPRKRKSKSKIRK